MVLAVESARSLRTHLRAEAATLRERGPSSVAIFFAGRSLATLLRCSVLSCALLAIVGQMWALAAIWLRLDESDAGISDIPVPPTGSPLHTYHSWSRAATFLRRVIQDRPAHVRRVQGVLLLVFFFLKSRTVRPNEALGRWNRIILLATFGVLHWSV